jgi:hypothetical protein
VNAFLESLNDVYAICGTGPEQIKQQREAGKAPILGAVSVSSLQFAASEHIESHS